MSKQAYNAEMIISSQISKLSSMGICSYIHFIKALKSKQNWMILFCVLCLNLFGCWVRRLKVTKHIIYSIYCLAVRPARSQMVLPSKRGHVNQKLITLASTIFLIKWMEIFPTQGICKDSSLATGLHTNYPCHSAILTSSTRSMILSKWKFVQ